jgi:hypothetical protein
MNAHRSELNAAQIGALEDRLAGTLRPVRPPRDFVQRLRGHVRLPKSGEIGVRFRDWERLLLAFGGVLSGTVVIITVARALYHVLGRRNG